MANRDSYTTSNTYTKLITNDNLTYLVSLIHTYKTYTKLHHNKEVHFQPLDNSHLACQTRSWPNKPHLEPPPQLRFKADGKSFASRLVQPIRQGVMNKAAMNNNQRRV